MGLIQDLTDIRQEFRDVAQEVKDILSRPAYVMGLVKIDTSYDAVQAAQSPGKVMQALTGNPHWDTCFDRLATLTCKKNDPVVFATVSALHRMGMNNIRHEPMNQYAMSGGTYMNPNQQHAAEIAVAAWLRPKKTSPEYAGLKTKFLPDPTLEGHEIRIFMNRSCSFLKDRAEEFQRHYRAACAKGTAELQAELDTSIALNPGPIRPLSFDK